MIVDRALRMALLPLLACAAAGCASAPATRAAPAPAVCVVSTDDNEPGCPEAAEPVTAPENKEPCVERVAEGFNHGPMARVHAFCTPAESARKAAESLRRGGDESKP